MPTVRTSVSGRSVFAVENELEIYIRVVAAFKKNGNGKKRKSKNDSAVFDWVFCTFWVDWDIKWPKKIILDFLNFLKQNMIF
jgi:hypothetical protein